MMKFSVKIELEKEIEIEASTKEEAEEIAENIVPPNWEADITVYEL